MEVGTFQRLVNKVNIPDDRGCWEYLGGKDKNGYGQFWINDLRRSIPAHRAMYIAMNGQIPPNLVVCHKCDNPSCCNPDHLFLGTDNDNVQDRVKKGRSASGDQHGSRTHPEKIRRGEANNKCKFPDTIIVEIRELYTSGNFSYSQLSKKFGISKSQISNIVKNKQRI